MGSEDRNLRFGSTDSYFIKKLVTVEGKDNELNSINFIKS